MNITEIIEPNFRGGENLRFIRDTKVIAIVKWCAPYTSGHNIVVPAGTEVVVPGKSVPGAEAFSCVPVMYDDFGRRFISEHAEEPDQYGGYV